MILKNKELRKGKGKYRCILLLAIISLMLSCCGCTTVKHSNVGETKSYQELPLDSSAHSIIETQSSKIEKVKRELKNCINENRVLIKELDFGITDAEKAHEDAKAVIRKWNRILGFGGFRTDISLPAIYSLGASTDNENMQQQMIVSNETGDKFFEYNIFLKGEVGEDEIDYFAILIQGITGVEIKENDIENTIVECKENKTENARFEKLIYENGGITVKVVELQEVEEGGGCCCKY